MPESFAAVVCMCSDHVNFACFRRLAGCFPGTRAGYGDVVVDDKKEAFSLEAGIVDQLRPAFLRCPVAAHIAFHDVTPCGFVTRTIGARGIAGNLLNFGQVIEIIAKHFELRQAFYRWGEYFFQPVEHVFSIFGTGGWGLVSGAVVSRLVSFIRVHLCSSVVAFCFSMRFQPGIPPAHFHDDWHGHWQGIFHRIFD